MADTLADRAQPHDPQPSLAPLPKRVADADGDLVSIADPVAYVSELLERTTALLSTLEHDVEGLQADQAEERARIEATHAAQQSQFEQATAQLGLLSATARKIAMQKGKFGLLEAALRLGPTVDVAEIDDPGAFDRLVTSLEFELKAARGITGGIRMPEIGRDLQNAALAVARMSQRADHTKQRLLARTEDELTAEGKEARASFEIGLGVLERDLELLDAGLPLAARPWTDPEWDVWEPAESMAAEPNLVRLGAYGHPDLPGVTIPALVPATGAPGLVLEGGPSRPQAVDAVRNLVLRLLAALPPGRARFSFIDPKGLGEPIAPFLGLAEYDAELVDGGVLTLDSDIEAHLTELTHHVERVTAHHLQGRYASLDEFHRATGEMVEPYRYLVIFDHPIGFTDRATAMLRAVVESGPRCGVTVIAVKEPGGKGRFAADHAIPGLPVIKSGDGGLIADVGRAGPWALEVDVAPPMLVAETGEPTLFERVTTATGALARQARRAPTTPGAVFDLLALAQRRRIRDDLPVTGGPIDPGEPATWWTGDAAAGLGAPVGRTADRGLATLWFDHEHSGAVVLGPPGRGVSSALHAILASLAVIYPPDELQMLLVGMGDRRELEVYGSSRLAHALMVASQAERELGLAVLEAALAELDRREGRFERAGTARLGLAGHRTRTGEAIGRVLIVLDGLSELFTVDDATAISSGRALRRLAEDGPAVGLHLLLADRIDPGGADAIPDLLDQIPAEVTSIIRYDTVDTQRPQPGEAMITTRGAETADEVMRTMWIDPHERAMNLRDLRRLADERGLTGGPQVICGGDGAELSSAPLRKLVGDPERRSNRRSVRLWLGEPATLGAPVEVVLRRQEGANLLVVADAGAVGSGVLFAALATARISHGPALDVWVLDLGPLEGGFGTAMSDLGPDAGIRVARRRTSERLLSEVRDRVTKRHADHEFDAPPGLLVVNGLGRARDGGAGDDRPDGISAMLAEILSAGPEVGVHVVVGCDSVDQFDRRLGRLVLADFGVCVATVMDEADSTTLLDNTYAATLRPNQALLADEDQGRLIKFRPYVLPPPGWCLPPAGSEA